MAADRRWVIYVCECGFLSMTPGKCRSHPFPCRAMGPELTKVEVAPVVAESDDDIWTDGDIGGLVEAVEHRLGDVDLGEHPGKVRRYTEIREKLFRLLSSRRLQRELDGGR